MEIFLRIREGKYADAKNLNFDFPLGAKREELLSFRDEVVRFVPPCN